MRKENRAHKLHKGPLNRGVGFITGWSKLKPASESGLHLTFHWGGEGETIPNTDSKNGLSWSTMPSLHQPSKWSVSVSYHPSGTSTLTFQFAFWDVVIRALPYCYDGPDSQNLPLLLMPSRGGVSNRCAVPSSDAAAVEAPLENVSTENLTQDFPNAAGTKCSSQRSHLQTHTHPPEPCTHQTSDPITPTLWGTALETKFCPLLYPRAFSISPGRTAVVWGIPALSSPDTHVPSEHQTFQEKLSPLRDFWCGFTV